MTREELLNQIAKRSNIMNQNIMKAAGFEKEVELVDQNICPFCLKPIDMNKFRNMISIKEYRISGLCQHCQDEMFGR